VSASSTPVGKSAHAVRQLMQCFCDLVNLIYSTASMSFARKSHTLWPLLQMQYLYKVQVVQHWYFTTDILLTLLAQHYSLGNRCISSFLKSYICRNFIMVALCNRADHYIFILFLSSFFFFSSPNLSGRRLDVYHTLAHGVALVRI